MKLGLAKTYQPPQPRSERVRQGVGVLADDEMALLQPQNALGLHAEGLQPKFRSCFYQGFPQVPAMRTRTMDLVAQFADEADAEQTTRHAGHFALPGRQVREGRVG